MPGPSNYSFAQALEEYNKDPVFTQSMWHIKPLKGSSTPPSWDALARMQIYGQGFEIPARTNDFASVSYRAYEIPTPTVPKMGQDHSMILNCDVKQELRDLFLNNMNATLMVDSISDKNKDSFPADRRPTAGIGGQQLLVTLLGSDYETAVKTVALHGVRVAEVGTLSLSNTDGGIATFTVNFKSIWWDFRAPDGGAHIPLAEEPIPGP